MLKNRGLFIVFLLCLFVGRAQHTAPEVQKDTLSLRQYTIAEDALKVFKEDPNFNYDVKKSEAPEWYIAFKNWLYNLFMRFFEWLFGVEEAAGAFQFFLRLLPYLLLAVLLFILIKFFLNVNARAMVNAQKNTPAVHLSDEEKIIKHEDIKVLIRQALEQNDYRLAVRYYYLYILQQLSQKEHISWAQQKTNVDYLNEIKNPILKTPFGLVTKWYDYIWYGEFPIDQQGYDHVESAFTDLEKKLGHA